MTRELTAAECYTLERDDVLSLLEDVRIIAENGKQTVTDAPRLGVGPDELSEDVSEIVDALSHCLELLEAHAEMLECLGEEAEEVEATA